VRQRQAHIARQPLHQAVLAAGEGIEIGVLQAVQAAGRHGRVKLDLLVFLFGLGLVAVGVLRRQRLAHAGSAFAGLCLAFGAGQQLRQQFCSHVRVAEIRVKQLAEHQSVLLAADHDGFHRRADILFLRQSDCNGGMRGQRDA